METAILKNKTTTLLLSNTSYQTNVPLTTSVKYTNNLVNKNQSLIQTNNYLVNSFLRSRTFLKVKEKEEKFSEKKI